MQSIKHANRTKMIQKTTTREPFAKKHIVSHETIKSRVEKSEKKVIEASLKAIKQPQIAKKQHA